MRQPSITDLARDYLEKAILTGRLKPGSQIKEGSIAEALEISRPPVREAFKLLEGDGLVDRKPRRGVFVKEITEKDALEIYSLKAVLYEFSITLAFKRLTDYEISRMGHLVEAMRECLNAEPPNVLSYQEMNVGFHDIHVDASGHQRLKKILWTLHKQVRYFSYQTHLDPGHLEKSFNYHQQIYEAFKIGDEDLAKTLTRDHVLAGLETFQKKKRKK